MADGLNRARALRITEIMTDFRDIQTYIAAIRANPSSEEYNAEGYVLLRRCVAEAQALLAQPFQTQGSSRGDPEQDKLQMRRIIIDAAVRRFKAKKIYLRATAALRWVNSRAAVLQGHRPGPSHASALAQIRQTLQTELASITDERVELSLRAPDVAARKWLAEDPDLAIIRRLMGAGGN